MFFSHNDGMLLYIMGVRSISLFSYLDTVLSLVITLSLFCHNDGWLLCTGIFSERELKFMFAIGYRSSVCLSVCLSSVTFVHPTQEIEIFGYRVPWPSADIQVKFY